MTPRPIPRAFTLAEVLLAVALIATGVTAVLGLLPALVRLSGESADTQTALRLTGMVEAELQRRAAADFSGLGAALPVMSEDPELGLRLVAARDGTGLRLLDPAEAPARDQYFLAVVRAFPAGPLAYDSGSAICAAHVLVAWPYRTLMPSGLATAPIPADRQTISFSITFSR